ncbi:MAG: LytR/AlgR family response regulator transcription factor [Bacteroidia bacterium]
MIKALIVDDERDAVTGLKAMLFAFCPEVEVIGDANSVAEAKELIKRKEPKLIFLDIEMPGANGFELLESFPEKSFKVIFTTAYDKHAVKAIRVSPVDYLIKPIDPDLLIEALERYKKQKQESNPRSPALNNKIRIATASNIILVDVADIVNIEADGRYAKVFFSNGSNSFISKNIGEFEKELLPYNIFFRVHRSSLINVKHIKQIIRQDGGYIQLSNDRKVEISQRKKAEFFEFINKT